MQAPGREKKRLDVIWLLVCAIASSVWCLTASTQLGATFDEPLYLARGLDCWRTGSHHGLIKLGTMPLPIDVQTLPLFVYERWTGTTLDPIADCDYLLLYARAGTLAFWWLLLLYAMLTGRQLAGPWGGRAAVALLAFEPNLLAHAALATTDIAVSACLLALVYHFRTSRERGWWRRVAVPAVWLAAAFLSKASGLVFGGICLLVVEVERVLAEKWQRGQGWRQLWNALASFRRDAVQIVALGVVLTFVYCGSDWQCEPSFVSWAHQLSPGAGRTTMTFVADHLRIFSNAGEGIVRQVRHNVRGHGVFLLGEVHPRALWYYFPVALTIKLPVPLLLLPPIILLTRPSALRNWACIAAAALVLFSVTCRVQIGIRLVLPLVVLGGVGLAAAAVNAWKRQTNGPSGTIPLLSPRLLVSRLPGFVVCAGAIWMTVGTVLVWPHGLCYVNECWGGREYGYRLLSDSNYDWGQGLKELAAWEKDRGLESLDVWYFGSDPALHQLPMRELPLHALAMTNAQEAAAQLHGRRVAVSTTLLYGMPCPVPSEPQQVASAYLRGCRPVGRTTTYLIYDFTEPENANTAPGDEPGRRAVESGDRIAHRSRAQQAD
jgi:hypothetical protein